MSEENSKVKVGYLNVIVGEMYSGKTSALINKYNSIIKSSTPCVVFKPTIDERYSRGEIVSHNGMKATSVSIQEIKEISDYLNNDTKDIIIDELHFFPPSVFEDIEKLLQKGINVTVAGLGWNYFHNKPFETVSCLVSIADYVEKKLAQCDIEDCQNKATKSMWILNWLPQKSEDYVGGKDKYKSVCRNHYIPITKPLGERNTFFCARCDFERDLKGSVRKRVTATQFCRYCSYCV